MAGEWLAAARSEWDAVRGFRALWLLESEMECEMKGAARQWLVTFRIAGPKQQMKSGDGPPPPAVSSCGLQPYHQTTSSPPWTPHNSHAVPEGTSGRSRAVAVLLQANTDEMYIARRYHVQFLAVWPVSERHDIVDGMEDVQSCTYCNKQSSNRGPERASRWSLVKRAIHASGSYVSLPMESRYPSS